MSLLVKALKEVPKEELEQMVKQLFENLTGVTNVLVSKFPELRDSVGINYTLKNQMSIFHRLNVPKEDYKPMAKEIHENFNESLLNFVEDTGDYSPPKGDFH